MDSDSFIVLNHIAVVNVRKENRLIAVCNTRRAGYGQLRI